MSTHGDSADATYSKQIEINEAWQQLQARANARKEKLLDSYDLQRLLPLKFKLRPFSLSVSTWFIKKSLAKYLAFF